MQPIEPPEPPAVEDEPASPQKKERPPRPTGDEARNVPPIALYVADRLDYVDRILTLRVFAEPGDYFNCYYKGRERQYRHVRLRGDTSMYLDGYVPRDLAGERLWSGLKTKSPRKLTVKVVMRPATLQGTCVGQVEVLDHREGWDFEVGKVGQAGAMKARIANSKDRTPARNRPSVTAFRQNRRQFVGKAVEFRVRARLDRYHQCRYRDAERTHYAVRLTGDGYTGLMGYVRRDERGIALAKRLAQSEGAKITVQVTIPEGRYDEVCPDQVEILTWKEGWGE